MFGVVLWSDVEDRKAVIWCEDHGDLAFYRPGDNGAEFSLDAGDLVQFDMTMDRHLRFVHNPRLVSEGGCEGLADMLGRAGDRNATSHSRNSAEIIPFSATQRRTRQDAPQAHIA
ncbi:MAG TPA: hypothetical protein DEA05_09535 [Rhodobacteraceae bacterium]|nr:hypothetical protein [Paracoccaceae bacterium]